MRTRSGAHLRGTAPQGGRWARQVSGRGGETNQRPKVTAILVVALLVIAGVAAFGWMQDRNLRDGLLAQRAEAAQRPDWVPLRALPRHVPLAFMVVVDPTFLYRAPLDEGAEGRTLSRDLLRQVYLLRDDVGSQARELMMGPLLEARLSQGELLELYLNRVYLGEDEGWPVFGIFHGAREYFDKEPTQLTVGEAATLAGLVLPPRITDPQRAVGAVGLRRNEVLRAMRDAGAIDETEYSAALQEPLGFQPGLEHTPMTRPTDPGRREAEVIRVPLQASPAADTVQAQ
ncbi:MAG: transglycosylase domain-containing protein [Gemmatimonadetes bacterium]|nr:transglycosylase domain-containing protein [Gemmatimonadota bacterium]